MEMDWKKVADTLRGAVNVLVEEALRDTDNKALHATMAAAAILAALSDAINAGIGEPK